jgi:superfamily II RNA helicase
MRTEEVRRIIYSEPEEVRSQFNASYATILNLYERYKEGLFEIYPLSFHYFQTRRHQQKEALRMMTAKLDLLKELGFIIDGNLTATGEFGKAVYGYELFLSDLYAEGVFEELDEIGLGVIAVATVFEPRKNQRITGLSKSAQHIEEICKKSHERIRHRESRHGIYPVSKPPHFNLAKAMEAWMHGVKFQKALEFTDTDEGELIRYFRMAMQILREIKDAPISPTLSQKITGAIRLINRDVIDAEKQLREG